MGARAGVPGGLYLDRDDPPIWGSPQLIRPTDKAVDLAGHGGYPTDRDRGHGSVHSHHRTRERPRGQVPVQDPDKDEDQDDGQKGNKWFHHNTPRRRRNVTPAATAYGPTEVRCA